MSLRSLFRFFFSLMVGVFIGVLFHYTLYRMGLPLQPFIYMSF